MAEHDSTQGTSPPEAGAPALASVRDGQSIEHIRELLVGRLVRALRKQLDEVRDEIRHIRQESQALFEEFDRKSSRQMTESRTRLILQIDEMEERFDQKLKTVRTGIQGKTAECGQGIAHLTAALEKAETRLRVELHTALEEGAGQSKEEVAVLIDGLAEKMGEIQNRLLAHREIMDREARDLREAVTAEGNQIRDEIRAELNKTAQIQERSWAEFRATWDTVKNEIRQQNDRYLHEVDQTLIELEERLAAELEERILHLTARLEKRAETSENATSARVAEVEQQIQTLRGQLEERDEGFRAMIEDTRRNLRENLEKAERRTEDFTRAVKTEHERRMVFREDMSDLFLELGMRVSEDIAPENLIDVLAQAAPETEENGPQVISLQDEAKPGPDEEDVLAQEPPRARDKILSLLLRDDSARQESMGDAEVLQRILQEEDRAVSSA
ncbi:MAG: hypothetical protein V1918_00205 [Planctomycetota bacterium]